MYLLQNKETKKYVKSDYINLEGNKLYEMTDDENAAYHFDLILGNTSIREIEDKLRVPWGMLEAHALTSK